MASDIWLRTIQIVRHMVKDHSDSEKGNLLPPHRLLLSINMHHPTDRIAYTMAFVTPVVEHWLERELAQWVHSMKDRSDDPPHHERTLLPWSYISLLGTRNSSMGPPHEGSIRRPIAPWVNALTTELHVAPSSYDCFTYWYGNVPLYTKSMSKITQKITQIITHKIWFV